MSTSTQTTIPTEPYIGSALHKERERDRQKRIYYAQKGIIWHCNICKINLQLNSKKVHIKTEKHITNEDKINVMNNCYNSFIKKFPDGER